MTNATKKKRTWAGYACPVCRFVFRVPKDHDGVGVICPACRYLLNIPQHQDRTDVAARDLEGLKPLATLPRDIDESKMIVSRPLTTADTVTDVDTGKEPSNPWIRQKSQSASVAPAWEHQSPTTSADADAGEGNSLAWIVGGSLIGLVVVAIGAWLALDTLDSEERTKKRASSEVNTLGRAFSSSPNSKIQMTAEELKVQEEIQESVNKGMDVMEESEKVVRAFLTAEKVADLEGLVRNPEVTIPRMHKWYANREWVTPGAKEIGYGGGITVKGVMASMRVRLNDYSVKNIAMERTAKGYRIDWESWVAWSEMDWQDIIKERPTELVKVRVLCKPGDYYNRLFKDESKWISVSMSHPDIDKTIYGYIESGRSSLTSFLGDLSGGQVVPVMIKIRFPEGSVADNQVIIEEYVQRGWVTNPKDKNPPVSSDEASPASHE